MAERVKHGLARSATMSLEREIGWSMGVHGTRLGVSDHRAIQATGPNRVRLAQATAEARRALEEAAYAAALAAERALTLAGELDAALATLEAEQDLAALPALTRGNGAGPIEELSPREREVLALVAEGRSNKSIAEALFVSPNTIKTHVSSLFAKLHAETRAQLAAIAVRQAVH